MRSEKFKLSNSLKERTATLCFSPQRLKKQYDLLTTIIDWWETDIDDLRSFCCSTGAFASGSVEDDANVLGFTTTSTSNSNSNPMTHEKFNRKFGIIIEDENKKGKEHEQQQKKKAPAPFFEQL